MTFSNSLEQLKAQAYDCLVQIETWQKKLQEVNQLILNHKEEPKDGESN